MQKAIIGQLIKISLRNVFRNKRRTLLTLAVLIMGSAGMVLVGGYFEGMELSYREQYIHGLTGHLQVHKTGFQEYGVSDPFGFLLARTSAIQDKVESLPHVRFTVPQVKLTGLASSDTAGISVIGLGVDPSKEQRMSRLDGGVSGQNTPFKIVAGQDLDTNDPQGIIVGKGLLKALDLKIGDTMTLISTQKSGSVDGGQYHIRGSFETIMKEFDDQGLKMNLATAQKLLGLQDEAHSLLVVLDQTEATETLHQQIQKLLPGGDNGVEVIPWQDMSSYYQKGRQMLNTIYLTVQVIIMTVFFFSMANTVNMAIFERMREFGTMLAIGNSRATVFTVIFTEVAALGFLGSLLGIGLGTLLGQVISRIGIIMPPIPGSNLVYLVSILLPAGLILQVAILTFGTTALAALFPSYKASRTSIMNSLGHV